MTTKNWKNEPKEVFLKKMEEIYDEATDIDIWEPRDGIRKIIVTSKSYTKTSFEILMERDIKKLGVLK